MIEWITFKLKIHTVWTLLVSWAAPDLRWRFWLFRESDGWASSLAMPFGWNRDRMNRRWIGILFYWGGVIGTEKSAVSPIDSPARQLDAVVPFLSSRYNDTCFGPLHSCSVLDSDRHPNSKRLQRLCSVIVTLHHFLLVGCQVGVTAFHLVNPVRSEGSVMGRYEASQGVTEQDLSRWHTVGFWRITPLKQALLELFRVNTTRRRLLDEQRLDGFYSSLCMTLNWG